MGFFSTSLLTSTPHRPHYHHPKTHLLHSSSLPLLHPHTHSFTYTSHFTMPPSASTSTNCHSSFPSEVWGLPQVHSLSGIVRVKNKTQEHTDKQLNSAPISWQHWLLIQGHECYSLSWKANLNSVFEIQEELPKLLQNFLRRKILKQLV